MNLSCQQSASPRGPTPAAFLSRNRNLDLNLDPGLNPILLQTAVILLAAFLLPAHAQLQLLPTSEPQQFFGGAPRPIAVCWKNPTTSTVNLQVHTRLLEASSATVAPLGDWGWKQLQLLPGQTVLETASIPLPTVRAETRCLLQWVTGTNTVLGTSELLVYPTNILAELRALGGDRPVGLFDPQNELKPLLTTLGVEFADLESTGINNFVGRLAIIGPFAPEKDLPQDLKQSIKAAAEHGAAVVWIQPPSNRSEPLRPSYAIVSCGKGTIVLAQASLAAKIADAPQAQLNLLQLVRLAVRHPSLAAQPLCCSEDLHATEPGAGSSSCPWPLREPGVETFSSDAAGKLKPTIPITRHQQNYCI